MSYADYTTGLKPDWAMRNLYEKHGTLVTRIAKREHKGAMTVDVDDVEQAIWLVLFDKIQHLAGYTAPGIADLATKAARTYLLKERIDYMHFMGNFVYTPEIVETYLKNSVWTSVDDVPTIDGRVDVTMEFNKLPLTTRQAVFKKFALGEAPSGYDSTARSVIDRAVVRITNNLNLRMNQTKVDNENV